MHAVGKMVGMDTLVLNYPRELLKYSTRKRKCSCLRGGVKIANCFGPWDYLSLDVPPGKANHNHISSGSFLLSELRQSTRCCKPTARPPARRCDEISLGYLSKLGRGGEGEAHLRFRHFESVEEHIKYYRENKPNSLHCQDTPGSGQQQEVVPPAADDVCTCCCTPRVKPLTTTTPQQTPHVHPSSLQCKCSHHLYHQPCPFPIRATGKAIIPTCASLIMRLPSLELSSDSYWVPVNAVFQKRHTVPTELYNSYDQNASSFNKSSQVELPSLAKKNPRQADGFAPSRTKTAQRTRLPDPCTQASVHSGICDIDTVENLSDSVTEPPPSSDSHEADTSCTADVTVGAASKCQTGSGRLLSGKLRGSSCIHPIHPEELQGLAIGVQRSPYDKLISNLAAMAHAKKSIQELYNSTTEYSKRVSARQGKGSPPSPPASDVVNVREADGLTLNKLDITEEHSEHELLAESAIFCGPTDELKLTDIDDTPLCKPFQDNPFKSSDMAITFTKPRKLFSVKSVQDKMRQHTYSDSKGVKNRSRGGATALKREQSRSLYNAKHRLALNKENSGGEEGVFGTHARPVRSSREDGVPGTRARPPKSGRGGESGFRSHPAHQASCALRSQERMRLRLKTATGSSHHHRESGNSSEAGRRKVQVYLIKTSRPLEDILPRLNSTEVYSQQNGTVDLFGE